MKQRTYVAVSGSLFGLVAVLHLLRAVNHWPFQLGLWSLPLWVSWAAVILGGSLCLWAFHLLNKA